MPQNISRSLFDAKYFNGEVFQKYLERVPNMHLKMLLQSGAITPRPELAASMADQVGGNYLTTPLKGLIGGDPLNYDGVTDITATSTQTYSHSRVVAGRAKAWTEKDFAYDVTGGVDFMQNVAEQVAEYWDEVDQGTIFAILRGIFAMDDTAGAEFVDKHTYDCTGVTNSQGESGLMDATTLNTGMQKAMGDHKSKFSLTLMHSAVATHLENLKVLVYLKYNDANGIERDLTIATLNGRTVLVDDDAPTGSKGTKAGAYSVTISTKATAGDTLTVNGVKLVAGTDFSLSTDTASGNAAALATALNASTDKRVSGFTWTSSSTKLIATEDTGHYGEGESMTVVADKGTSGTLVVTAVNVETDPESVKTYHSYVFGQGAIEFTNCGAKVPAEMSRDPKTNGGQDTLYSRQRKCWAPYGISFTGINNIATLSPTDAELAVGSNWEIVNTGGDNKIYLPHKAIPIARIISLG